MHNEQTQSAIDRHISDALQQLPAKQAPARVLQRSMQQIATRQKLARHLTMNVGFSLAFAASLFAALIVPDWFTSMDKQPDTLSTITMSLHDQRTINIVFDSPEDVARATITVSLPDNLQIAGYDNAPRLQWDTPLRAGKNTLSIPLVARNGGEGVVRSQLEINGRARSFNVLVNVADTAPPASAILTTHS